MVKFREDRQLKDSLKIPFSFVSHSHFKEPPRQKFQQFKLIYLFIDFSFYASQIHIVLWKSTMGGLPKSVCLCAWGGYFVTDDTKYFIQLHYWYIYIYIYHCMWTEVLSHARMNKIAFLYTQYDNMHVEFTKCSPWRTLLMPSTAFNNAFTIKWSIQLSYHFPVHVVGIFLFVYASLMWQCLLNYTLLKCTIAHKQVMHATCKRNQDESKMNVDSW